MLFFWFFLVSAATVKGGQGTQPCGGDGNTLRDCAQPSDIRADTVNQYL